MNEVLMTNVFFAITAAVIVVLGIFLSVALYYFIRILRNVRDITDKVKKGSEQLAEDALAVRSFVRDGIIGSIKSSIGRFSSRRRGSRFAESETDGSEDDI